MKNPLLALFLLLPFNWAIAQQKTIEEPVTTWQSPPEHIMKVLHSAQLPNTFTSPTGKFMMMGDPVLYPSLKEMAGPMHKLAGIRVNPANNNYHGRHGMTSPRLLEIKNGKTIQLELTEGAEIHNLAWTADGNRFALSVGFEDRIELWLGDISGKLTKVNNMILNPLLGSEVSWLPDQQTLLVRRIPDRGPAPTPPAIPRGPMMMEDQGATARSTYEARNLLETSYDDDLFTYYTKCELVLYDTKNESIKIIGKADHYGDASVSPDGKYLLVSRLVSPWSHEVAYWRFATDVDVWDLQGNKVADIASLPTATNVPTHGVPEGPRGISWRPTAPHTLYWVEALDGGNPVAEVPHRDRLMRLEAPFTSEPDEIFKAEHRLSEYGLYWGEKEGMLAVTERERMKRWRYFWLLDVDKGTAKPWFDYNENDRYNNPGYPIFTQLENGKYVMKVKDDHVYFRGTGGTDKGDRPFLDRRNLKTGKTERLFRSGSDRYEYFITFADDEDEFVFRSESSTEVPNYYLAEIGKKINGEVGEATRAIRRTPITKFDDPTPELRKIKKQIVRYEREDGIQLSFTLMLPPDYKEGTRLPTVVYAYPLEYSGNDIAGQVRGSAQRFMRIWGPSHEYFLLNGYAVLDDTAMPMVGDPETVYDTFIPQLVADAEAAVKKVVDMGIADPDRIGVIGHSHGGLMVANLLAHTDLFAAGIARSGSYNKTTQPFGYQGERRSLFEARDAYIQVSPTFFADQVNEPVLIIHGNDDSNPGTLTFQSEVFYEAVRGSGGTARLVLLPFEDHGYRAKESVEHVLWEQLQWFDKYVKNKEFTEENNVDTEGKN